MVAFTPSMIVPMSKSAEFKDNSGERTPKTILLEGIEKQIGFLSTPSEPGKRWFTLGKKECSIEIRLANRPLKLVGEETKVVVPVEHAEAAFGHFKNEVIAGKYDDQIAVLGKMLDDRKAKLQETRRAKKDKEATVS